MIMSSEPVIFYRYDSSPFSHKIDNVLALKRIPHENVNVSPMLPRAEITNQLGIGYRRIPILAIGNDVYCDTSLIVTALERRFPPSSGFGTILPRAKHGASVDTGLVKAFSKFYGDNVLFRAVTSLLPWDKLPAPFIKDRSALLGGPIDVKAFAANAKTAQSQLASHLTLIEEQLSDSREWLFETESPSLADITVHFILAWARSLKGTLAAALVDQAQFPYTVQWLERVSKAVEAQKKSQAVPAKLDGTTAANKIVASTHESYVVVGFDSVEAARLGVAQGDILSIAPEDSGRNFPTTGKLVGLNREELVLEIQGSQGLIRCHFPRLGFFIVKPTTGKL